MQNYNSERDCFINEEFKKAYFDYWDSEAEFGDAINNFFDETKSKNPFDGLEELKKLRGRLEKYRDKLREAEKKLQSFR